VSVVLADDHDLVRDGVTALIERHDRIHVVASAKDAGTAVASASMHQPDVILLDVEMPGGPVTATIARLSRVSPNASIIILTMHRDLILRDQLLLAGASDYLLKSASAHDLVMAILRAATRQSSNTERAEGPRVHRGQQLLTRRERQVLMLMSEALSNEEIGAQLSITKGTVKRHARNIFEKLGATSRMDAVKRGSRLGFLEQLEN
jgi:DNA-binding NarL/FixJ family response regulator